MVTTKSALFLGIDVGTSSLKAVLLDAAGTVVDDASADYPVESPAPGWTQQDPDAWWKGLRTALTKLWQREHEPTQIEAIGLTGQMHSLVILDATGEVVCPAILWSDQRTRAESDEITRWIGREHLLERTGNLALPGFTAPKIHWVRRHWPDAYARAAHFLLAKDFIRYRLTGDLATDPSDASGTALFDVRNRRWADDVRRELEIDARLLPTVAEGTTVTGVVNSEAALALGLRAGTRVVAGGGDNAAAAVGLGAVAPGVLTISLGTSGVIFAPIAEYPAHVTGEVHVFCHAIPDRWHMMTVTLSAGGSLHWFRALLEGFVPASGDDAYAWLTDLAATSPPGSNDVLFLPYLSGERTPYADPLARGVLYGLHLGTTLADVARSVLEGVAFSQRQGLGLIRAHGAQATVARGAGGGLISSVWRQVLVDALDIDLQLADPRGGAARGAAVLAGIGIGMYSDANVGVDWATRPLHRPDPVGRDALADSFATYEALYPALRSVWSPT
jgi:xylulokinase